MVIPNIILLCDIIYNLEIFQSAKKGKAIKNKSSNQLL